MSVCVCVYQFARSLIHDISLHQPASRTISCSEACKTRALLPELLCVFDGREALDDTKHASDRVDNILQLLL